MIKLVKPHMPPCFLSEMPQTSSIKFALGHIVGEEVVQLTPWFKCREYFNDFLQAFAHGDRYQVYGYKPIQHKPEEAVPDLENLVLIGDHAIDEEAEDYLQAVLKPLLPGELCFPIYSDNERVALGVRVKPSHFDIALVSAQWRLWLTAREMFLDAGLSSPSPHLLAKGCIPYGHVLFEKGAQGYDILNYITQSTEALIVKGVNKFVGISSVDCTRDALFNEVYRHVSLQESLGGLTPQGKHGWGILNLLADYDAVCSASRAKQLGVSV